MDKRGKNEKSKANLKPFQKGNQASKGYGRPRIPLEERAISEANYSILNTLIQSGEYERVILASIQRQLSLGKIDTVKFLMEQVTPTIKDPGLKEFTSLCYNDTEGNLISFMGFLDDGSQMSDDLKELIVEFENRQRAKSKRLPKISRD